MPEISVDGSTWVIRLQKEIRFADDPVSREEKTATPGEHIDLITSVAGLLVGSAWRVVFHQQSSVPEERHQADGDAIIDPGSRVRDRKLEGYAGCNLVAPGRSRRLRPWPNYARGFSVVPRRSRSERYRST
jgi:hypothetical protein